MYFWPPVILHHTISIQSCYNNKTPFLLCVHGALTVLPFHFLMVYICLLVLVACLGSLAHAQPQCIDLLPPYDYGIVVLLVLMVTLYSWELTTEITIPKLKTYLCFCSAVWHNIHRESCFTVHVQITALMDAEINGETRNNYTTSWVTLHSSIMHKWA